MSKILEKLEKINRVVTNPLGFSTSSRVDKIPAMAIIVTVYQNHTQIATRLNRLGVDGVIFCCHSSDKQKLDSTKSLNGVPWGLQSDVLDSEQVKSSLALGCDFFIVSPAGTLVDALNDERCGYFLMLPNDPSESFLRSIEGLPIDGVLMTVPDNESSLTLLDLASLGSIRVMFDKYFMVQVSHNLSTKDIRGLRDIGVDAIVVDGVKTSQADLKKLKDKLLEVPQQRKSKGERASAISSQSIQQPSGLSSHDDDDDEF